MTKENVFIFFVLIIFSCSNLPKEKDSATNENKLDINQILQAKADQFYDREMYREAKLCYDSLIRIDSTIGEYYFRRAYSTEKLLYDDPDADADYLNAIKYNYQRKQSAYFNLGIRYRFKAVFRRFTNKDKIAEYDSALFFFNECLKLEPTNKRAIKEKEEIKSEIKLINNF